MPPLNTSILSDCIYDHSPKAAEGRLSFDILRDHIFSKRNQPDEVPEHLLSEFAQKCAAIRHHDALLSRQE